MEPITEDDIVYSERKREVYHSDVCFMLAEAHHAANYPDKPITGDLEQITLTRASILSKLGLIDQPMRT